VVGGLPKLRFPRADYVQCPRNDGRDFIVPKGTQALVISIFSLLIAVGFLHLIQKTKRSRTQVGKKKARYDLKVTIRPKLLAAPSSCVTLRAYFHWLGTETVRVAEEQDTLALTLSTFAGLDPVAHSRATPHGLDEADRTVVGIGAVVAAHDLLDGLTSLVGVVEGNGGHVVVQDVGLDNTVKQLATDEAKLAIDSSSGATDVGPRLTSVVRERRISVLQKCNGDCIRTGY